MDISTRICQMKKNLPKHTQLIAVSKLQSINTILRAYHAGQRLFGENKAQEIYDKYQFLPKDIEWHFIGHLQTNKIRYIAPFIKVIHSIDSLHLLKEINRYAIKCQRKIKGLLQIHIAQENHKFGFSQKEVENLFQREEWKMFNEIEIVGFMGLATLTQNENQISQEFSRLSNFFTFIKEKYLINQDSFKELSIGMSNDYHLAIRHGSTMVRIGSYIFG